MIRLSCLQHSLKNFKTGVNLQLILQLMAMYTHLDATEHDDENEEDDVDREMSSSRRDQVRQAIEIIQSCCLYQDDREQKMWKKVAEAEKLCEIS